jgi:hypothetical protein
VNAFRNVGATFLIIGLVGCASSERQAVVENVTNRSIVAAQQTLTTLERTALAYTSLPACETPRVHPCADPDIKARIKAADMIAYNAVMRARRNQGSLADALVAIDALERVIPGR